MTQKKRFKIALEAIAKMRWPRRKVSIMTRTMKGRLEGTFRFRDGSSYWAELEMDQGDSMVVKMPSLELTVQVPR